MLKMKVWVVGWPDSEDVIKKYTPIGADASFQFKVHCSCKEHSGWHYGSIMAVFASKAEAIKWAKETHSLRTYPVFEATLQVEPQKGMRR